MNEKQRIERIEIPEIREQDLLETIQRSMQVLQKQDVQKMERYAYKVIKEVIFHYGKREVLLQCGVGIVMLLVLWLSIEVNNKSIVIAFFIVGSMGMSTCISSENLRSRIYQMWELEQSCPYSPAKIIIWKSLLLSVISIIVITLSSLLLQNHIGYSMSTLLIGGCIPFFLMNALVLQFQRHIESMNMLLILYISSFVLFLVVETNVTTVLFSSLSIWFLMLTLGYFLYNLYHMKVEAHML